MGRNIITAAKLAREILGGISLAFFHRLDNNYLITIPSTSGLEISVYLKRRRLSEEIWGRLASVTGITQVPV